MRQITQNLKSGHTSLAQVPAPVVQAGTVLIRTTHSLVSLGTERMLVEFGKASLIQKARQQPDKVKMVLDKIKSDGLLPTLEAVFNKLDQPLPLGYCNVGEVVEVGDGVMEFSMGDRVASNGPHAEFVCVPKNLVARIPENVSSEEATFTVIGAIALQGIRLVKPELGETVVVFGLGLIGLMAVQLLRSSGCRSVGIDIDPQKLSLAREMGVEVLNGAEQDPVKFVQDLTDGVGADAVLITASAKDHQIVSKSAQMSRKRGRIVLVGVVGLQLNRSEFYEKELTFQVSCSYGPGRYDPNYEQYGIDYPLPFVRWTEKRNFQAVLQAISSENLKVGHLITQRVTLDDYSIIYRNMSQSGSIASIIEYPASDHQDNGSIVVLSKPSFKAAKPVIGIIGAGNFTKMTMLPALKSIRGQVKYIASAGGLNATSLARKYSIPNAASDYSRILEDPEVTLVMITTRHHQHASMVVQSLQAGKHVFVEKPLALNLQQLTDIIGTCRDTEGSLTVGFNRRFAPLIRKAKSLLGGSPGPVNIVLTMNAGFIPPEVWVQDMEQGGGRIIGEACHHIDLASYLCDSQVVAVCMNALGPAAKTNTDNASILLKYQNGSNAVINYFANGNKAYSKERVELHYQGKSLVMDNFRYLYNYGFRGPAKFFKKKDKGHKEQFSRLLSSISEGGGPLIPLESLVNTSLTSIKALESLQSGAWVEVN